MHPDIREIERAGPAISAEQAREIVRLSSLAPIESDRKVLILAEFHLLRPEGAALLLKTIEEPPPSTIFLVLADFVPTDLVTISSRCARIEFRSIDDDVITERLVHEGVSEEAAADAARSANGDLQRARLLAADPDLVERRRAFASVPSRLDGNGATVMRLVDELLGLIDSAAGPLSDRHATEVADVDARIERFGERGSGKKTLDERHKRELRRHRTDELRHGLSVLAGSYRDALVAGTIDRPGGVAAAVDAHPRGDRGAGAQPERAAPPPVPLVVPPGPRGMRRPAGPLPSRTVCLKRTDARFQADRTGRSRVRWHR